MNAEVRRASQGEDGIEVAWACWKRRSREERKRATENPSIPPLLEPSLVPQLERELVCEKAFPSGVAIECCSRRVLLLSDTLFASIKSRPAKQCSSVYWSKTLIEQLLTNFLFLIGKYEGVTLPIRGNLHHIYFEETIHIKDLKQQLEILVEGYQVGN